MAVLLATLVTTSACMCVVLAAFSAPGHARRSPRRPYDYCRYRNAKFHGTRLRLGVTALDVPNNDEAYRQCALGRIAAYHFGYVRFPLGWVDVEKSPGVFNFARYDTNVYDMAVHHETWFPILLGTPRFRSVAPYSSGPGIYAPRNPADFARFAAQAVKRYGPSGSFWRTHPTLPYYPVRAWQIWNEPDLYFYWLPHSDVRAYVRLLQAGFTAIKTVDPRALVVTAGVPFYSLGASALGWYTAMYQQGARNAFDVLAINAYAPTAKGAFDRMAKIRRLMNQFGDRRKPIWTTEFGWAASGPPSVYRAGRHQAAKTRAFLRYYARYRKSLRLGSLLYYDWRDLPVPRGGDYFGLHTGLYTVDGLPRRVAGVVSAAAARLNW